MQAEQLSLFDNLEPLPQCPFLGRRVAVTGSFALSYQALRAKLLRLGATDVKFDKLQRNTHLLLVGKTPNHDVVAYHTLYVHDGFNIKRLSSTDLDRIFAGDYAPYQTEDEVVKNLHLTREHLYWNAPEISGLKNNRQASPLPLDRTDVLYGKEIYAHASLLDSMPQLGQLIGCLGGYANTCMTDDTDYILVPESMPKEVCHAIEAHYNKSRSVRFDTPFIILEGLVDYLRQHPNSQPPGVMAELLAHLEH